MSAPVQESVPAPAQGGIPAAAQESVPPAALVSGSSADAQAAAFANDPRVHFDRTAGTWRFEQDDGTELEYDAAKGAWVPVLDEELVKAQQAAYSVAGVDEETPAAPVLKRLKKKRKEPADGVDYTGAGASKRGKNASASGGDAAASSSSAAAPAQPERRSKNTAVYVTGLPLDTDVDEIAERFGKYGLIEEDDEGHPKIKLYARWDGSFSGDALVVYFKEESVPLAIDMLDDAEFRMGSAATRIRVMRAEFTHKHDVEQGGAARPRKTIEDKKRATRRIGKMQKKLGEWVDEDGFGPSIVDEEKEKEKEREAKSRIVVLKHMFTLHELEEDPTLLLDLKEDVREECSRFGEVTNVTIYDLESDGVMTVKFREHISASNCRYQLDGRYFAGRVIEAYLYTGKERFRRSGHDVLGGNPELEKKRLDDFAKWLEQQGE